MVEANVAVRQMLLELPQLGNSVGLITNNNLSITLGAATGSVNSVSPRRRSKRFSNRRVSATGIL